MTLQLALEGCFDWTVDVAERLKFVEVQLVLFSCFGGPSDRKVSPPYMFVVSCFSTLRAIIFSVYVNSEQHWSQESCALLLVAWGEPTRISRLAHADDRGLLR